MNYTIIQKGLSFALQIMYMVKVAQAKYTSLMEQITAALDVHDTQRVAARVRRKQPLSAAASKSLAVSQPTSDVLLGDYLLLLHLILQKWSVGKADSRKKSSSYYDLQISSSSGIR